MTTLKEKINRIFLVCSATVKMSGGNAKMKMPSRYRNLPHDFFIPCASPLLAAIDNRTDLFLNNFIISQSFTMERRSKNSLNYLFIWNDKKPLGHPAGGFFHSSLKTDMVIPLLLNLKKREIRWPTP